MRILVVDGALANVGIALVDTSLCPASFAPRDFLRLEQAAHGLVCTDSMKTKAGEASVRRARRAAAWLEERIGMLRPDVVIFEVPAKDGSYARVQARQRGLTPLNATAEALLNRGIGALAGAVRDPRIVVLELRADGHTKEQRATILGAAVASAGRPPVPNEHRRDAAYYAITWGGAFLADPLVFRKHVVNGELREQAQLLEAA